MSQSTYYHYPSFTRRYIRSILAKYGGAIAKNKKEAEQELLSMMVKSEDEMGTLNGQLMMMEWWQQREGQIVVPEPSLSEWLQGVQLTSVEGDAWDFPYDICTISLPTQQRFEGHRIEGLIVSWVTAREIMEKQKAFIRAHSSIIHLDFQISEPNLDDQWLAIGFHNPLDKPGDNDPTMLRVAMAPQDITDFINSSVIQRLGVGARSTSSEETRLMQSVTRYVLSLGMYLSAYPTSLTQGVPAWMKNKHPKDQGRGVDTVSYSRHDAALQAAMTSPRTVAPHWRQLRHSRYYQKQFAHLAPGSRYVLVSGYDVGSDITVGVERDAG